MTKTPKANCPSCGKQDTWKPDNAFKPFCSERCKLIDLGAWADESYRVAGQPVDPRLSPEEGEAEEK